MKGLFERLLEAFSLCILRISEGFTKEGLDLSSEFSYFCSEVLSLGIGFKGGKSFKKDKSSWSILSLSEPFFLTLLMGVAIFLISEISLIFLSFTLFFKVC